MSGLIAGAIAGYVVVGGVVAIAVGAVVGYVVGGAIIEALTPDMPDVGAGTQGSMTNKASANDPIPIIYGTRRIGATQVFADESGDENQFFNEVLILGEGEIDSVTEVWADDYLISDATWGGKITATIHTGTDTQAADAGLKIEAPTRWTTNHKLSGVAYAYVKMEYDQDIFSGIPTMTFTVKGAKVHDPRTPLVADAWSDNPALCIRDYLTNERYGRGLPASEIDEASFIASANHCDDLIELVVGAGTVKRYLCNGIINTESGSIPTLKALMSCCRGMLVFTAGKYKLINDKVETAGFAFDDTNVIGGWNISMGSKANRYNKINASFTNKETRWRDDIAHSVSATYKTNDNGLKLEQDMRLPFTTDIERAQVLCALMLNQSRQQIMVSFTATIEALQAEVGEVVTITDAGMGWVNKTFRIERINIKSSSEVKVTVREYEATVYDFTDVTSQDSIPNTNLPDFRTVGVPHALSTTETLYDTIGSAGVKARVTLSWVGSHDVFVREYESEWTEVGGTYKPLTFTRNTQAILNDANPVLHNFRVRAINTVGVRSAWSELLNVTVAGLTAPPVNVSGLSLIALNNSAHLSWDTASDLDVRVGGKVRFRHSHLTTSATWGNSTDIGASVSGNTSNAVLPLITGTYSAKFVDSTGNESISAASFASTTVPNITNMNAVSTTTEQPTFGGVKTSMSVVDGVLKLADPAVSTSGSYAFNTYTDLGKIYTSRLTAAASFAGSFVGDTIDSRTSLIDTWTDFEAAPANISLNLFVSTTDDDPAGTPTWSAWAKFLVADYSARAFKFKLDAATTDANHQINITALSIEIDMPDKVQGAKGLATLVSGALSVVYAQSFKEIPALGVTFTNLDSNDVANISNESTTGFDITIVHGGTAEVHNFNYVARGW